MNLALDLNFAIPGDPGWPLNQVGGKSGEELRFSGVGMLTCYRRCTSRLGIGKRPSS
jgi:hypothetical protein